MKLREDTYRQNTAAIYVQHLILLSDSRTARKCFLARAKARTLYQRVFASRKFMAHPSSLRASTGSDTGLVSAPSSSSQASFASSPPISSMSASSNSTGSTSSTSSMAGGGARQHLFQFSRVCLHLGRSHLQGNSISMIRYKSPLESVFFIGIPSPTILTTSPGRNI